MENLSQDIIQESILPYLSEEELIHRLAPLSTGFYSFVWTTLLGERSAQQWKKRWMSTFATGGYFLHVNHYLFGTEQTYLIKASAETCEQSVQSARDTYPYAFPDVPCRPPVRVTIDQACEVAYTIMNDKKVLLKTYSTVIYWRDALPDHMKHMASEPDCRITRIPEFTKDYVFRLKSFIMAFCGWLKMRSGDSDTVCYTMETKESEDSGCWSKQNILSVSYKGEVIFGLSYHDYKMDP